MRTGVPRTSTGSVATSGPTTNATRYVDIGMVSPKRTLRPPWARGASWTSGPLEYAAEPVGDVQGDREDRLAVGLVEAGKGAARRRWPRTASWRWCG